jgi:RimJ/RimL family protein N-acetyltransferase
VEFRRVVVADKDKGIGQLAIAAMERFCRAELERKRIWLDVFESNHRGRHVYEKLGYQRFGESSHPGGKLLLYEKAL